MQKLSFERHVGHSPERMLALAWDVQSYPDFVPNCLAMEITPEAGNENRCRARMHIQFGPISQAYTSLVTLDTNSSTVTAEALDGPFSHLVSVWKLIPEGAGTLVRFDIDFALRNPMLAAIAEPAFAAKQEEIIEAFVDEAGRRYARS